MRSNAALLHIAEDIVPLSDFEANPSSLMRKLRETGRAVVLTEAGRPAAVLVTPEEFDELHDRERVVAAVERGRADLRAGRVIDDEELSRELDEKYGPAE
jgi:prevent-host-death family protein